MNKKNKLAKPIEYKITDYMQKFINSLKSFGLKVNVESGGVQCGYWRDGNTYVCYCTKIYIEAENYTDEFIFSPDGELLKDFEFNEEYCEWGEMGGAVMRKEMFYVTVDNHKFKTQEEAERHEKRYLKDLRAADNFTVRVFNKQNNRWDTIHFKDGEIVEEEYDCNEGKFTDKVSLIEFPSYAAYQVITRKISLFRELFKRTINSRENLKFIIFHTYGYDCIALSEFKKELEKIKEKENEIIEAYGGNWKEIN